MDTLNDSRLGDYVITRCIATGGMATVYEAKHHRTNEPAAIKVLARDLRTQSDPLARILQEGRVITSLLHENIVRVFDYGTADENVGFVVMELLDGQTLGEVIDSERYLAPERAVFIGRQICAGLAAAHARDIYHRDVKPGNILLAKGQRFRDFVKLLDFGIARLRGDDPAKMAVTAKGMTLGTPQYMSPEQATGEHIDARSDIYQVGLVLYECLVGEPPFQHQNAVSLMAMHLSTRPRPLRERRPNIPEELEQIVLKCLAKKPNDRYQTAEALGDALDGLAMRITLRERARLKLDGEASIVSSLHLPTLGSPAELARFASNLSDVLEQLWPDGDVPETLREIQGQIWRLTEEQLQVGTDLAVARADTIAAARGVEERQRPLERAIQVLVAELERVQSEAEVTAEAENQHRKRARALDAEYAQVYEEIETHQRTLYTAADARTRMVDFRDLFREDIAARLDRLEDIFRARADVTTLLEAARSAQAATMGRVNDLELQLCELRRSALSVEAERVTHLAELQAHQAGLEGRHRALERALEHHHLKLGLAFRRAISKLIEQR